MEDNEDISSQRESWHDSSYVNLDSVTSNDPHTNLSTDEFESMVTKEVRKYRMKYLCTQSFTKYRQYRKRRILSGKGVFLVLFLGFLERLAYWGALGNILPAMLEDSNIGEAKQTLVQSILQNIVAQLLYPIAGFVSDVWIGRYKAIYGSLWILWSGYALLAFFFSFSGIGSNAYDDALRNGILPLCFLLISIGAAGFQANMIPFGADQIICSASEQLSSYFYWYYWTRNLAGVTFILSFSCSNLDTSYRVVIFAAIGTASVTLALICNILLKDWLFIDPERRNPMKTVGKVLYFASTAKRPQVRSAFSFNSLPPPRMDLAKARHGGRFTNEQVEDVKTFLRLLAVLVSFCGVLAIYTGMISVTAIQVNHMDNSFLEISIGGCALSDNAVWTINVITIIAAIPLLNMVIYPFLREYTPNMLKRIGIGYILALSCTILLMILEGVGHHESGLAESAENLCIFTAERGGESLEIDSWWILLPYTAINLTEVLIRVTCLEFLYAQSPHSMKGMMIGLFFFIQGLSAMVANLILFIFSQEEVTEKLTVSASTQSCGFWYYLVFFIVAIATFSVYLAVSKWYKKRERGDLEEDRAFYRLTSVLTRR